MNRDQVNGDPRRAHMPAEGLARAADRARSRMDIEWEQREGTRPKSAVDYRPASSSERCGKCEYSRFGAGQNMGSCVIVAGRIAEGDVCDHFSPAFHAETHGVSMAAQLPEPVDRDAGPRDTASSVDDAPTGHVNATRSTY